MNVEFVKRTLFLLAVALFPPHISNSSQLSLFPPMFCHFHLSHAEKQNILKTIENKKLIQE